MTAPTTAALPAPRLHNLRPVGGMKTTTGARVRDDLVWRSAAPFATREASSAAVAALGVRTIVDLRDAGERERTPRAWAHQDLSVEAIPVFGDRLHTLQFDALEELYGIMIGGHGGALARAFQTIAHNAADGVLFHCTAGKDRTGVLGALVLEVLEVERELILADFALSQHRLGADYLSDLFGDTDAESLPGIAAHRATASPPELLAGALTAIDSEFGGPRSFLLAHGATTSDFEQLRATMLVAEG